MRWHMSIILVVVAAALTGFIVAYAVARHPSAADRAQQNYLNNYLFDLENPSDANWSARRYECVDSSKKANRFVEAGATSDDVNKYLYWCSKFEADQK